MNYSISNRGRSLVYAVCLLAPLAVDVNGQEEFRLTVDGNAALSSTALLSERELVVTDAQGTSFRYAREPQFDSADGQYIGFYNAATQQPLRWPTAGRGAMQVGDPRGLSWKASRQLIEAVALPGSPVIRPRPVPPIRPGGAAQLPEPPNPDAPFGQLTRHGHAGRFVGGPFHVATGADRRGRPRMATIDETGLVRVFDGDREGWRYSGEIRGTGLVPGAPLGITPDVVPGLPRVFTVNAAGSLVMLTQDQAPVPVAPVVQLPHAAHLTVSMEHLERRGFAVDVGGRLWNLDLTSAVHEPVESDAGLLVPGSAVQVLSSHSPRGEHLRTLLLTDAHGTILRYQTILGGWSQRAELAVGFVPGAPVGAADFNLPNGNRLQYLAAVDWRGQLQLVSGPPSNLQVTTLDTGTLPPGAHVLVHTTIEGPLLSAVGVDGVWRVWKPGRAGVWEVTPLHGGFPPGAPVIADPLTDGLIAVDVRGRIIPAHWHDNAWTCTLCHHTHVDRSPRLVSRRIVPNPALPPANVTLQNGGDEEIVVQLADAEAPANAQELKIAPHGSLPHVFERDAGATIEEVFLIPDPVGGWTEQTSTYPIPPQPRYSLAVWANRTTYQYINKNPNKPQGALPDFDLKSHVSLGVLDLPPGELLRDGEQIDVYRAAVANQNPGAAGYLPLPAGIQGTPRR